jgi:hypothetical protein
MGATMTKHEQFLPQRFRWRSLGYVRWKYGVMLFNHTHELWEVQTFGLHPINFWNPLLNRSHQGPSESISFVIGQIWSFEWLDNDFAWPVLETKVTAE